MRSGPQAPRLSGSAEFRLSLESESETVLSEERGGGELRWEEDRLTGQVYQVMADERKEVTEDYDFQRAEGTLEVEWRLTDPESGRVINQGALSYRGERSHGGYLNRNGRGPRDWDPERAARQLEAELARQAAAELIEMSGPLFTSSDLSSASDPLSQRASQLVARGDWEGASALWDELLTLNPGYAPALYNLGLYREKQGELTLAWERYRQAFLANQGPMYRAALTRLTEVLRHQNQLPKVSNLSF
jgi:tetratricopeptide (TPR) repeat protein